MKADIGITDANTQTVALFLNQYLSDVHVLYIKIRNYHWNIEGSNFIAMHRFYETLYLEMAEVIDELAERIRKIGHFAEGRLSDFIKLTNLLEGEYSNDQQVQLGNLLSDYETIIRILRKQIPLMNDEYRDFGTADLLTSHLRFHESSAWKVRALLYGK
jgi:starvation-inducible DNA-binding protein